MRDRQDARRRLMLTFRVLLQARRVLLEAARWLKPEDGLSWARNFAPTRMR
jgi:hypothetical protein